jgi:hypothetical protein
VVLEDEKSWSSFVLVPVSGEASFVSGSESRVHFSGDSSTGRYIYIYIYITTNVVFDFKRLSKKWWLMEQFGYYVWFQQCQIYKDRPSLLQGGI